MLALPWHICSCMEIWDCSTPLLIICLCDSQQHVSNYIKLCCATLCVHIHMKRMQNNSKARQRFTAVVNFNSKLPQHVQDINILMVTSQWKGRGVCKREVEEG